MHYQVFTQEILSIINYSRDPIKNYKFWLDCINKYIVLNHLSNNILKTFSILNNFKMF